MEMSLQKRFGLRPRALLVGLGVLGCCVLANLVLAEASSAAVPAGNGCVASDGKISGRGASYQAHAEAYFAELYNQDQCGNTPGSPADVAGENMLAYNYPAAEAASATGASAGLKAASCRTDAYAGDSLPYTEAQLAELNGVPGKTGGCSLTFDPPFKPQATGNKYPNAEDIQAPIMSFPIAGSSVALPVNLTNAVCTAGTKVAPTSLQFNAKEVSRIFGGDAAKWNDAELVANNPTLANCEGAITRVVRFDSAGTTEIFKAYLVRAENGRSSATCAVGKTWSNYTKTNTEWPGKQSPGTEGTCTTITTAAKSGGPEEVKKIEETPNGIGYADLPDAAAGKVPITPSVQNATATSYQGPNIGESANCNYSVLTLPGGSPEDYVGLDTEDNWGTNNQENPGSPPNHQNATDLGSKYPICGITFDLVYTGLDNAAVPNAIGPLTADQRRTLYSYFTWVLSSTFQDKLSSINYAPLPTAWLGPLTEGFQENF